MKYIPQSYNVIELVNIIFATLKFRKKLFS